MKRFLSACVAGLPCVAPALTLVGSDFESGAEGWKASNGLSARSWVAAGGMPGGYVQATDNGQGTVWFFEAPAAFLGDRSDAVGGTLSFWLKVSTLALPMRSEWADVRIGGGGIELALDAGDSPGLDWTYYSVLLAPGAWRVGSADGPLATAADFATVFADIDHLWIRGEYSAWWDTGSLDTVRLTAAVPELPSTALLAFGLATLAAHAHRRRPSAA